MPDSFFDTNTLLYVASQDTAKAERAEDLIRIGGVISVQVLNEMANVARRKMRLDWDEIRVLLGNFRDVLQVNAMTLEIHNAGLAVAERYKLSIYDAMIVASALDAGCRTLWSEDMQHGQVIDNQMHVLNPFRQ